MELFWTKAALQDITNIQEYYVDKIPADILSKIIYEIENTGNVIRLNPGAGRLVDLERIRKFNVLHYSYILTYEILKDSVRVLGVIDTRRKPKQKY